MTDFRITKFRTDAEIITIGDARYLKLDCSNDPLTNGLQIIPYYAPSPASSDNYSLYCSKNIKLKAGAKLIFDSDGA